MKNRNTPKLLKLPFLLLSFIFINSIPCRAQSVDARNKSTGEYTVTLQANDVELAKVIDEIKKQTPFKFFYNAELGAVKVSAKLEKTRISSALDILLKNTDIEYKISEMNIWLAKSEQPKKAQTSGIRVYGTVTDETGEPLIGVHVSSLADTKANTVTDFNGEFQLEVPAASEVRFSYISFSSVVAKADASAAMNIIMKSDVLNLDEIVVIGYGTIKKSSITSAISSIKSDDFTKGPITSPEQLLRGKVAGLSINTTSGDPNNQGVQIMLRGVSNLSGNQSPLVVIDGIPGGDLSLVAPEDIESIDILKDGSAAAIYGTRGTNGVIIVSTKKGSQSSKNKISVEYHGYAAYETISNKIDVFSSDAFRAIPETTSGKVLSKMTDGSADVDWFDNISRNPFSHVHNLSIRSGDAVSNFIANVNYRDQNGILAGSERQQVNARLGVNHAVLDERLRFNFNVSNTSAAYQEAGQGIYFNVSKMVKSLQFIAVTLVSINFSIFALWQIIEKTLTV